MAGSTTSIKEKNMIKAVTYQKTDFPKMQKKKNKNVGLILKYILEEG